MSSTNNTTTITNSTNNALNADDLIAGLTFLIYGLITFTVYFVTVLGMYQCCKRAVGFIFLFSQGVFDLILIWQFTLYPAFFILTDIEFLSANFPDHVHYVSEAVWFAMVYHYTLVAWSRLAAIKYPLWFRVFKKRNAILLCVFFSSLAFVQSVISHQMDFYVIFVFDKDVYGMKALDWQQYINEGTSLYFLVANFFLMSIPIPLYIVTTVVLLKQSKVHQNSSLTTSSQAQLSAEKRLLIPCAINTVVFVFGQIWINYGPVGSGKWAPFSINLIFATNSAINPILYLAFSKMLRREVLRIACFWRKGYTQSMITTHVVNVVQHQHHTSNGFAKNGNAQTSSNF